MEISVASLIVLALCVWRISSLVAEEHGPFFIFCRLRTLVGVVTVEGLDGTKVVCPNVISKGIVCVWCNSVWFGVVVTVSYILFPAVTFWVALPLALSAFAIMVQEFISWQERP